MALARRDALEAEFEHLRRLDAADRAEGLDRRLADDRVHLAHLGVREAGIGLGEGHELAVGCVFVGAPDGERVVAVDAGAPAVPRWA